MKAAAPRKVEWRQLTTGATVWAASGRRGWRAATVLALGKNRAERTVVVMIFDDGRRQGRLHVSNLYWRNPALRGADMPAAVECQEEID